MDNHYKTVKKDFCQASFEEKKSQFISYVARIETEEDAKAFIEKIKTKHSDATHNVFAYIVKGTNIARFSDDGEPSGTAGMPVLEVIKREDVVGVCIVVTRYFGGTLLGAGGLVRAYAKAAKLGLDAAEICKFVLHNTFDLVVEYSDYEKISKELEKYAVINADTQFSDKVYLKLSCEKQKFDLFDSFVREFTNGKCNCKLTGETFAPAAEN